MRIVHIGNASSIFIKNWTQHFAQQGHEVSVISLNKGEIEEVKVYILSNKVLGVWEIKRLLNAIKPDIVHAHYTTGLGFMASLAGYHPLIVQAWGSDILLKSNNSKLQRVRTLTALNKADVVVTASEFLGKIILEKYSKVKQLRIIPIGIPLNTFAFNQEHDSKLVFSPRSNTSHYRQDSIADAVEIAKVKIPDIEFIQASGDLSPDDMASLYRKAVCMISIPVSDQFSSCIQEAMACGCVPIVADLPPYHVYLRHEINARFVSDSIESLANEIIWCLENPAKRVEYALRNREIVEKFENWDKNILKLEELYEELA